MYRSISIGFKRYYISKNENVKLIFALNHLRAGEVHEVHIVVNQKNILFDETTFLNVVFNGERQDSQYTTTDYSLDPGLLWLR